MLYAILSDVHANVLALAAVLDDARRCGAGRIICLGDVVGYGPEPEKAVELIRRHATVTLAGNHDAAVAGILDASDFIGLAADAVLRHRDALSDERRAWLKGLPLVFEGESFVCAHGDFTSPETFEYVTTEEDAARNFAVRREQLMFTGHSHVPGIFLTGASGKVYALAPADFTLEDGKRYIVNPGSVGYPRTDSNICETTYVLYDSDARTIEFRHLPFTVRSVMQTGVNPKRIRRRAIALIALAAALFAATAAWFAAPDARIETRTEVVTNRVATVVEKNVTKVVAMAHVDRTAECPIPEGTKKLQLNVKLSKGSPAVHLQLAVFDASGATLWDERWTAKRSKKAAIKLPSGARHAKLSAGRIGGDTPATFDTFSVTPVR